MTQTFITVAVFVLLLAMVPMGLKWLQTRSMIAGVAPGVASKVISAVAVGPHQRVVTVEVGPPEARTWLVLGVTGQNITCLHDFAAVHESRRAAAPAVTATAAAVTAAT